MTDQRKQGNPNPSPATRFGAGNRANPAGKTSETRRLELQNAEAAMRIRAKLLEAAEAVISDPSATEATVLQYIEAAMLKLLKDSEDRGLGAPVQAHTSPDGSMTPQRIILKAADGNGDD